MKKTAFLLMSTFITASILLICGELFAAITVVSARGEASFLRDGQWKPLTKGMTLEEGTKICTGVKSIIVLNIDRHVVTISPMTSVKIYKNSSTPSTSDTSIGLQYGSVKAKVKRTAAVKTRFNITTPVATSSVRGTEEVVSYGPASGMTVQVIEGAVRAFSA
ncbi:MAG: FecR family protein, partial [Spirochaetota bacterium]